jgi:hypothetical protein
MDMSEILELHVDMGQRDGLLSCDCINGLTALAFLRHDVLSDGGRREKDLQDTSSIMIGLNNLISCGT